MLLRMVVKSLLRSHRTTLWVLASLTLCSAMAVMFATMSMEAEGKMTHELRRMGANAVVYDEASAGSAHAGKDATAARWEQLQKSCGRCGAMLLLLTARIGLVRKAPIALVQADAGGLASMTSYWSVSGRRPSHAGECLVGGKAAKLLSLQTGSTLDVEWPGSGSAASLSVVGIFDSGDEDEDRVFVTSLDLSGARHASGKLPPGHRPLPEPLLHGGQVNCLSCHRDGVPKQSRHEGEGDSSSASRSKIEAMPIEYALLSVPGGEGAILRIAGELEAEGAGLAVKPLRQITHGESAVLYRIRLLTGLALAAVMALSVMGVAAAMLARIRERRKELALLHALGGTRRSVAAFLMCEGAALGLVAALGGFIAGNVLSAFVMQLVFRASAPPRLLAFLAGLVATLVVVLLVSAVASSRALKLDPAMALRGE